MSDGVEIRPLAPTDVDEIVARFRRWRFSPAGWLPFHESAAIPFFVRQTLADALARGSGFVARGPGAIEGVATFERLEWDTGFFRVPCGQLPLFHAEAPAAGLLARTVTATARAWGLAHVRVELGAGQHEELASLQQHGWRVAGSGFRSFLDLADCDRERTGWPKNAPANIEVVPYEGAHLGPLLEVAARLGPSSWLQREGVLDAAARRSYPVELTRNCLTTDFADVAAVLLEDGRPRGMNAAQVRRLPAGDANAYTVERFAFMDSQARGHGLMALLLRGYLRLLANRVRYVIGRMMLENDPMTRLVTGTGARPVAGHHFLVLS